MAKDPGLALINFFDHLALGTRTLQAFLVAQGIGTDLIFLKKILPLSMKVDNRKNDLPELVSQREYELLGEYFAQARPRVIGFSLRSFALEFARRCTELAREKSPDSLIVWGGTHPTVLPEESLSFADAVCLGEGEEALAEVFNAVREKKSLDGIGNIWFRREGATVKNPLRPLLSDLDRLPFPLFGHQGKIFIEHGRRENVDPMIDPDGKKILYCVACSRGCPFGCDFCTNSKLREIFKGQGLAVRKRSPQNVIDELLAAREHLPLGSVAFQDEVFGFDREWAREFLSLYAEKINLPFIADFHPKNVNRDIADWCALSRIAVANMGVQSGSENFRREHYHRMGSNEEILSAAGAFKDAGINCYYDFIFDNPYQTEADLRQTLELMLALPRPHNFKLLSLCWFPGTRLTERALADGIIRPEDQDQFTRKSLTDHWANSWTGHDQLNAFYSGLAWLELIKYDPGRMEVQFLSNHPRPVHLAPRALVRFLSRSRFLAARPEYLFRGIRLMVGAGNIFLVPLRKLRSAFRIFKTRITSGSAP